MKTMIPALLATLLMTSAPAVGGARSFTIANGTGAGLSGLAIHRFGTSDWQPLTASIAPGAQSPIQFSDADCAFDIRATLAGGGTATWSGVNLCEAKIVTLKRDEKSRSLWVECD